ncbi:MAG: peptidase [Desulfobacteraceae bacterium]|nr:MAG: peptidase [Desulfobacteraceae bacterium]
MFSNFIYFIIALITLTLYQPTPEPAFNPLEALAGFVGLTAFFAIYTRSRFLRLARRVGFESRYRLDHRFSSLMTRHCILALAVFAADIWLLDLPSYLQPFRVFSILPTLENLLFLLVFVGYLSIIWTYAYDAHNPIYQSDISRGTYVYSNIAFSVPILLPWALLFGISDLLLLLPFDLPKRILNSSIGQTAYFLIFLIVASVFAPVLIQRFWRCRPLESGHFRQRIEELCRRAGVQYADIVYWPIFGGRLITAGVMGLAARFRYILVTDALLHLLTPDEIDQVIAHEIGHVHRRHLLLYLLFFIGFMLISYATYPLSYILLFFFKPVLGFVLAYELNPATVLYTLSALLLLAGIIIYFRFIFGFFIRNFERQADLFVFRLFPSAQPLITTFGKIAANSGQPADKPNWHHFSIQERMDYLRRCEAAPVWIKRHDRKVRIGITAYIIGFIILAAGVFQLNQIALNQGGRYLSLTAIEDYLAKKAFQTPEDALLYGLIGNLHLERNNPAAAVSAYEKALALNPDLPDILNNLAWLLATAEDEALRNPRRALMLVRKAIALQKKPHIWDTLAEALYVNGHIREAIEAEQEALAMNPEDRKIYEDQLKKFREALGEE